MLFNYSTVSPCTDSREEPSLRPAQYKIVTKRIIDTPPTTKRISIPAEYKTVKVYRPITPPEEHRIAIPSSYSAVSRQERVLDGHMQWMRTLCLTNMTRAKITQIQTALKARGYYRGPLDGMVSDQTISAMREFQDAKGLTPTRHLTYETIKALGVE